MTLETLSHEPEIPLPRLTRDELAARFASDMGWPGFWEGNQGKSIFTFLCQAAEQCDAETIVLDISAGQCRYRPFFQHCQYVALDNTYGDPSWDYSKLDLIGDALQLPVKNASVDVCLNFTSLEHYPDPQQAFREFARVLKPGGRLFLYVPFVQAEHQAPYDFFRYTRYGLAHLCQQAGLALEQLKPANGIFETALNFLGQAISLIGPAEVQNRLREIVTTQLEPVFKAAERVEQVAVAYPQPATIPQLPVVYCLSALRPGQHVKSARHRSRSELVRALAACPSCKGDLDWDAGYASCTGCHARYGMRNGIPELIAKQDSSTRNG